MIFKKIYWDVTRHMHRDSDGNELQPARFPEITFAEQGLVNLQLVTDSDLTPFTGLGGSAEFNQALVDNGYSVSAVMILSGDTDINLPGDWDASGGQADPAQGQYSIRLDANTTNYLNAIGSKAKMLTTKLELQVSNGSGIIWTDRMPFNTKALVGDGPVPPSEAGLIETVGTGPTQCLIFKNEAGVVLRKDCPLGVTC